MHLSLLDAFGASAAPGAPPPSALAGDGGPVDGGEQGAGFVALLDAAATEPAPAGASDGGSVGSDSSGQTPSADGAAALSGAPPVDATLAAALHATWWRSPIAVPESTATGAGEHVDPESGEGVVPDAAIDPDDNAAAEWFIASGAVLTALVVVDEAPPEEPARGTEPPSSDAGGNAVPADTLDGDQAPGRSAAHPNESSPAFAIASQAHHDAGVRQPNQTLEHAPSSGAAAAAHANAAERRATSVGEVCPPVTDAVSVQSSSPNRGGSNPLGEPLAGESRAEVATALPSRDPASPASTEFSRTPASTKAPADTASEIATAVAQTPDASPHGTQVASLAAAEGQARAEERRSSIAAARLASGIERGGGATAVATRGTASSPAHAHAALSDDVSMSAVPASDAQFPPDDGSDRQPGDAREGRVVTDAPVAAAPVRPASAPVSGDSHHLSSAVPAAPMAAPAPAVMTTTGLPASSTGTPDAATLPQLVQAIRMQYRAGGGDAVVRLNPEHLGAVTISLRVERGVVTATVHADSPAVRQWLEEQAASLREGLSGHGLHLDRFVVQRDGRQPEQQRHYEDHQAHRRRAPRRQAGHEQATFEVRV